MIRNLFLFCLTIELLTGCRTSSALSLAAELQIQEVHDKSEAQLTSLKYTLGPLDVLEITLYERPEFKREVTISRQGTFQYPLIGEVRARGLTVAQLEKMLTERLQHAHIPDPHVAVTVKTYHNHHIFLLGQVELPGVYALPARVELKELIIQAQGLTSEADDYLIVIHGERQSWFGQVASANHMREMPGTRVDLRQLMSGEVHPAVKLRSGDTIYVPRRLTGYAAAPCVCRTMVWRGLAYATLQTH